MSKEKGLKKIEIPKTHNELFEFIGEHKAQICSDWELLFDIIKALDGLLRATEHMCDLHKDTRIILEAIKIQQHTLLREIKNDMTFEKALALIESDSLDDFFENVKAGSQCMTFIDHLNLDHGSIHRNPPRERIQYDRATGSALVPDLLEHMDETRETNAALQQIKNQVLATGKAEYFRLICDQDSFSATVLNAFNVSLALRMKLVSLKKIDSALYAVPYESGNLALDHSVLEITPKQYREIKKQLGVGSVEIQP